MKNKLTIVRTLAVAAIMVGAAGLAFAQTESTSSMSQVPTGAAPQTAAGSGGATAAQLKLDKATATAKTRGLAEIDRRITSLNALLTRLSDIKNIPDVQKSALATNIQGLIDQMNNLKTAINGDATLDSLKADIKSITTDYRVYALAMPQVRIIAAADRITTIVNMLSAISSKLSARITGSTNLGNLADLQNALSDLDAKAADAQSQAMAATQEVAVLVPDQGDKDKMAANTAALKDARTKIQAAQKDIAAARKDADTIIKALVAADKAMMKSASSTQATSPQIQ